MTDTNAPLTVTQEVAERAVRALYERDPASRGLGIQLLEVAPGLIRASMKVRPDMVNGHDICHGGYIFTLADSAFAFCCNSFNVITVASGASIDFLAPARAGDELTATATQVWRARRTGLCDILVTNQHGVSIAVFRGRSYQLKGSVVE